MENSFFILKTKIKFPTLVQKGLNRAREIGEQQVPSNGSDLPKFLARRVEDIFLAPLLPENSVSPAANGLDPS